MAECAGGCGSVLTGRQKKWCSLECRKLKHRESWLEKIYGITIEQYQKIYDFQDGCCGICGRPPKSGRTLAVDHQHVSGSSGPIRGLLCFFCNRRILGARSEENVLKAAAYLQERPAVKALGQEVIAPGRPKKKRQPKRRARK